MRNAEFKYFLLFKVKGYTVYLSRKNKKNYGDEPENECRLILLFHDMLLKFYLFVTNK